MLIQSLQNPKIYNHPVKNFKVCETHISWVILTGDYAYKIKKPLNLEFLDFTTLEKRKMFCQKECELNQLLAPEIYLEVVPITGSENKPEINGHGKVIEYAIKMCEFSQDNLFSELVKNRKLKKGYIDALAKNIANFHLQTDRNSPNEIGTVEQVHAPVLQNFQQIRDFIQDKNDLSDIDALEKWANQEWQRWHDLFVQRKNDGFIRACHGDIHLGNITLIDNKPVIFDCIEFNEEFRWTDVIADIAFLYMDLIDHQLPHYANQLLNLYFSYTGDYQGLALIPYYTAYRAVVRAKINLFQWHFSDKKPKEKQYLFDNYHRFIKLAKDFLIKKKTFLAITHGYSGSGKSTISADIVKHYGAIQIRSDIERKRLAGLASTAQSNLPVYGGIYNAAMSEKTYQHLLQLTDIILNADFSVIVDAAFLKYSQRQLFKDYVVDKDIAFIILHTQSDIDKMKKSILLRKKKDGVSEAREDILLAQLRDSEELTSDEKKLEVVVSTKNKNWRKGFSIKTM